MSSNTNTPALPKRFPAVPADLLTALREVFPDRVSDAPNWDEVMRRKGQQDVIVKLAGELANQERDAGKDLPNVLKATKHQTR
jgi:hypothetical protein